MEQHERDRPKRRRRRHGRPPDHTPRPSGPNGLSPIAEPRRLDLDRPVTEPLSPDETREMAAHLLFLRTYKRLLGLSLNATEDLLINGDREPSDRGICKHLLSKVDRRLVEKVLARDTMKADARARTRFLAGIVRLNRDVSFLIWYLQALAEVADRREAAAAFALTVDRIDFARMSNAQTSDLLELIVRTFDAIESVYPINDDRAPDRDRPLPPRGYEKRSSIPALDPRRLVEIGEKQLEITAGQLTRIVTGDNGSVTP